MEYFIKIIDFLTDEKRKLLLEYNENPSPYLKKKLDETDLRLRLLLDRPVKVRSGKTKLWSVVETSNNGQRFIASLVPENAGGIKVEDVNLISVNAGLGQALVNRHLGEKFIFNNQEYIVRKIS